MKRKTILLSIVLIIMINKTNCQDSIINKTPWTVDWSSDGKYIITSSEDGIITLWDKNAEMIKTIKY